MTTHEIECGCLSHKERDAAIRAHNAECHRVFETMMADRLEDDPWPFLPADHEVELLALTHWLDPVAVPGRRSQ